MVITNETKCENSAVTDREIEHACLVLEEHQSISSDTVHLLRILWATFGHLRNQERVKPLALIDNDGSNLPCSKDSAQESLKVHSRRVHFSAEEVHAIFRQRPSIREMETGECIRRAFTKDSKEVVHPVFSRRSLPSACQFAAPTPPATR